MTRRACPHWANRAAYAVIIACGTYAAWLTASLPVVW